MVNIIDGKTISEKIKQELKQKIARENLKPCLSVIIVGENPDSQLYVQNKEKSAKELGIKLLKIKLDEYISQAFLLRIISGLNDDPEVDGIIVQLPLPKHIDARKVSTTISPDKDVDGFHPINQGNLLIGNFDEVKFLPCTPKGIMRLIHDAGVELKGKNAVVVGRGNIVGKPVAVMLMHENATVTQCHSGTKNISDCTKEADVVVVAAGCPGLIKRGMVKEGAAVIDVGISKVDGKWVGDVDFENVKDYCENISPVPGGVGPMTVAMLMENVVVAAERKRNQLNHKENANS